MNFKNVLVKIKSYLSNKRDAIFGNTDYDKFVIVTRSRTGSNLLKSLLNSHPEIIAEGELFRRLEGRSCKEIWDNTFSPKSKKIKYIGFKLFYYHPLDSDDKEVWEFIKSDRNIKIIHLTRENILRTVVSREIADKTNAWTNKGNKNITKNGKQIELDIDYCLSEFELTKNSEEKTKVDFADHDFIQLSYEDLSDDKQKVMNELFQFLSVDSVNVSSSYKKQNVEKLKDLVTNYDKVYEQLEKTKWANFLN